MSADKYPSIFSRQMKAIVYLLSSKWHGVKKKKGTCTYKLAVLTEEVLKPQGSNLCNDLTETKQLHHEFRYLDSK